MDCRDRGFWRAYLDGEVGEDLLAAGRAHLTSCSDCRSLFDDIRAGSELAALAVAGEPRAEALAAWGRFRAAASGQRRRVPALSERWRPAIAAGVVGLMLASLTLAPVRTLAANLLQLFRLERFEVVQFDPRSVDMFNPEVLGLSVKTSEPKATSSPAEAAGFLGGPLLEPAVLPSGYARVAVQGWSQVDISVKFDLEKLRRYVREIGVQDVSFPDTLDGATVTGIMPGHAQTAYGPPGLDPDAPEPENRSLVLFQGGVPYLSTTADVDADSVRDNLLKLPILPSDVREQLRGFSDWRRTLPIPIPRDEAVSEKVLVDGEYEGLYLTGTRERYRALLWNTGERIFALVAPPESPIEPSKLFEVAASVPD